MNAAISADKLRAEITLRVPFYDLDPVGIVWHGNYVKYFELARTQLFTGFNYSYDAMRASGFIWPVIDLHVRYVKSIVFEQEIKVTATLREWEYRLLIDYLITDVRSGRRLTKGRTVQVAVDMQTQEMCLMSPPVLFEKLGLRP